jgi:hypothetical protein
MTLRAGPECRSVTVCAKTEAFEAITRFEARRCRVERMADLDSPDTLASAGRELVGDRDLD